MKAKPEYIDRSAEEEELKGEVRASVENDVESEEEVKHEEHLCHCYTPFPSSLSSKTSLTSPNHPEISLGKRKKKKLKVKRKLEKKMMKNLK